MVCCVTSAFPLGRTAENVTDIVRCEMIVNVLSLYIMPRRGAYTLRTSIADEHRGVSASQYDRFAKHEPLR